MCSCFRHLSFLDFLEASPVLGNPFVGIIYLDCEGTDLHLYLFVSAHFLERLYFTAHLFAYRDTRWEKKRTSAVFASD